MNHVTIVIHGLVRNKKSMQKIVDALRITGSDVVNWNYNSTHYSIDELGHQLNEEINMMVEMDHYNSFSFVCHSLGCLNVRRVLKLTPYLNIKKIVLLAPPNRGSHAARIFSKFMLARKCYGPAFIQMADPQIVNDLCGLPTCPTIIFAGIKSGNPLVPTSYFTKSSLPKPNDGTVSVEETALQGIKSILVNADHTFIMDREEVIGKTVDFLRGDYI